MRKYNKRKKEYKNMLKKIKNTITKLKLKCNFLHINKLEENIGFEELPLNIKTKLLDTFPLPMLKENKFTIETMDKGFSINFDND